MALRANTAESLRVRTEHAPAVGHGGHIGDLRPRMPALAPVVRYARVLPVADPIQLPELRRAANALTTMRVQNWYCHGAGPRVQAPDTGLKAVTESKRTGLSGVNRAFILLDCNTS